VDAQALQQAITNLVMNAIQAASGGGSVSVRVLYEEDPDRASGRSAVVEVADDGVGIPDREMPMIFAPFFTTKPVGEGTGLGLAVAHGIVEEHGGRIEVRSERGRGSVFRIRLEAEAA
jgi:two-component system NtrC family sensor kinase